MQSDSFRESRSPDTTLRGRVGRWLAYLLPAGVGGDESFWSYLRECGVEHLLIDLPSVDREEDGGKLLAHKAFWNYPKNTRLQATITELVYVPSRIEDGFYFLNLQPASFENDAAPCKPVLYKPEKI